MSPLRVGSIRSAAAKWQPFRSGITFLLTAIFVLASVTAAQGAFTLSDEKKLGKEFYDNLEKH
ncbi:MAG TPA: hypothetical protein PLU95_10805, partial [Syntrophales bacterium]|nr:hypothetical protein [Syntrophales bacterium]